MPGVPSLITSIPTFTGTPFFLCDEMHLIARGIGILSYNLVSPAENTKFKSLSTIEHQKPYTFDFDDHIQRSTIMDIISNEINQTRLHIPTTFQGSWDSLKGFNRAVDWLDYLLYVVPTLIVPRLKYKEAQNAFMDLVNGCSIALQWSISEAELNKMDQ